MWSKEHERLHRRAAKVWDRHQREAKEWFTCPECGVPAFFPYGSKYDTDDLRAVPRWLCKQCGFYYGPEGRQEALYDPVVDLTDTPLGTRGCWQLVDAASEWAYLPRDFIAAHNTKCCEEHDGQRTDD